ncbi:unnamed protein product, partial [Ixodes persulcatus]
MGSINCQVILLTKNIIHLLWGCHAWPSPEGKGSKCVKKKRKENGKRAGIRGRGGPPRAPTGCGRSTEADGLPRLPVYYTRKADAGGH